MNTSQKRGTLGCAIILAAGESRRMGRPKALLPAAPGKTFLQQIADRCAQAGLDPIAVTGAHAEPIFLKHPEVAQVFNTRWKKGQFSSVRGGLEVALTIGARRILIQPVDVPDVRKETYVKLARTLKNAAVASYDD